MPSMFGTDKVNPKGSYKELGQTASDDELSLSDDERVLFKKSGEIELNLCPETRIQRAKKKNSRCRYLALCGAIFVIVISLVTVAFVYGKTHSVKQAANHKETDPNTSQLKPNDTEQGRGDNGWKVTFKDMASEGSVRLLDVDGDGKDDIIFASLTANKFLLMGEDHTTKYEGLHNRCKNIGKEYPCIGNLIALNGHNGSQLWSLKIRAEAFVLNCEDFDMNKDGKKDCIATGRKGLITAFDPYEGKILWTCEDDNFFQAYWNTYHAAPLPDWSGDGVPEVLIANGGDASKEPEDHDRAAGRLVVLSGATGKPLGKHYLEMPYNKETYMSPVMFTPTDGGATYILFGSGGETIPGDLMGISVIDFCHYILGDSADVCGKKGESEYSGIEKDKNGVFVIYKGKEKGVMVPPVIVDYDSNNVKDILMTSFEGINNLYSGTDLQLVWTANFPGMETYGTPAPGHFDEDNYIDFMVTWNLGAWMSYNSSSVFVISGSDGKVIWSLESAHMQMSSSLSIATTLQHQDAFLFKVQGRESKFRWTSEGIIRPGNRGKRHDENPPAGDVGSIDYGKHHLTCEDDLTSYKGEVFVIDQRTVKNPVRILEIPTQNYTYDADPTCSVEQSPVLDPQDPSKHGQGVENQENQENSIADTNDNSDDNNNNNNTGGREGSGNRKKREEVAEKKTMCAVEDPDGMSLGIIGEVDGDGNLDYISISSTTTMLYNAKHCHQGLMAQLVVEKVNLEKGLLDGTFSQVAVDAKTSLLDSGTHSPAQNEKTFLHMSQQRWTQYFGTRDNSVYR